MRGQDGKRRKVKSIKVETRRERRNEPEETEEFGGCNDDLAFSRAWKIQLTLRHNPGNPPFPQVLFLRSLRVSRFMVLGLVLTSVAGPRSSAPRATIFTS